MIFNRSVSFSVLIILSMFLVGIFYAAPQFLISYNLKNIGKPTVIFQLTHHSDEAHLYAPRAREIYDGHFPPGDLSLNFKGQSIMPWLPAFLFSGSLFLLNGDIDNAYLLNVFIFTGLIFLLFYFLGMVLWKSRPWSLFFAFIGILTPIARNLPGAFSSLGNFLNIVVKNFYPLVKTPLTKLFFDRFDDPLFTFPVYLLAILGLVVFWKKPKLITAVLAAVPLGLLAYTYFHYWVYAATAAGLLFIYSLIKIKDDPRRFKMTVILILVAVFLTIPYFINYFNFARLDSGADFVARLWIEQGRNFRSSRIFEYLFYLALGLLNYFYFFKKDKNSGILYFGLIGAMFIVWNIQLITGYVPHPYHWYKAISPIIFIFLFHFLYSFINRYPKITKIASRLIIILTLLLIAKKAVNAAIFLNPPPEILEEYVFSEDIVESWNWIEKNLKGEPKIISPSFVSSFYFNIYTSARPFLPPGLSTLVANGELEDRFLTSHKLFGISKDIIEKRLRGEVFGKCLESCDAHTAFNLIGGRDHLYYNYYKNSSFDVEFKENFNPELKKWSVPEPKIQSLLREFDTINIGWKDIDVDYVYYGPREKELGGINLESQPDLKLMFKNSSVSIFKILKYAVNQ